MEFNQARRDGYFRGEDVEQHGATNRRPAGMPPPPSSSSTSSSSPTQWAQQAEASDNPPGGSADTPTADQLPLVPADQVEKEHMFDKVVTPSDVGKLNRLVIPKQHAERFFPLDASTNERGLLLNFEDRSSKQWRFRYSYWNSSQSYVMTKGWSRFVKEKRLDAGDTVSFGRGVGQAGHDRLFIDWKHRPESHDPPAIPRLPLPSHYNQMLSFGSRSMMPWSRFFTPPAPTVIPAMSVYDHHHRQQASYGAYTSASPYLYFRSAVGGPSQIGVQFVGGSTGGASGSGAGADKPATAVVYDSVPVAHNIGANSKRVRLFGVNFDCSSSSSTSSDGIGEAPVASQVRSPLPPVSLELSLGASTTDTEIVEAQSQSKDKQPMYLDFDF